jgi:hypothetical protein
MHCIGRSPPPAARSPPPSPPFPPPTVFVPALDYDEDIDGDVQLPDVTAPVLTLNGDASAEVMQVLPPPCLPTHSIVLDPVGG